jgi:monoamine oxidase
MQAKIAIIEGGLAGLYAGTLLHTQGNFKLIEARGRLGGRIPTVGRCTSLKTSLRAAP